MIKIKTHSLSICSRCYFQITIILLTLYISGCVTTELMSAKSWEDIRTIKHGMKRDDAIKIVGKPESTEQTDYGFMDTHIRTS